MLPPVASLPEILQARISYIKKFSIKNSKLEPAITKILLTSDFAWRQKASLQELVTNYDCRKELKRSDYEDIFKNLLDVNQQTYIEQIRKLRHYHILRLIIREYAEIATIEDTLNDWSGFADAVILTTIKYITKQLNLLHGRPLDAKKQLVNFYTIAMGKLGGSELNFSSDIDLIFAYTAEGYTDGPKSIDTQQFFKKLVQQFIAILQNITKDGFVFRVDLRLRPNGESGPLVTTLSAMETYYQEQGRDWERYAMVKARPIVAKGEDTSWFTRLIIPFVYRRYVDYSVIDSLRSMKSMIEREVQINPMLNDIKRGKGGIREIEFTIQCFQLIKGGRLPQIRTQNALEALNSLRKEKLLQHTKALAQAYLFLRKLENILQLLNDQQIHQLPEDGLSQTQVALALDLDCWENVLKQLAKVQKIIAMAFTAVLGKPQASQDEQKLLSNQLLSLWHGHIETVMAINLLKSLGFDNAQRCYQMLNDFKQSSKCRRLSQVARLRLDKFMMIMLHTLATTNPSENSLLQMLNFLSNIVSRSAYISLLSENTKVLYELLHWFHSSPFITDLLIKQPFLLEVLINAEKWYPLTRVQLKKQLKNQLQHVADEESYNEILRQFKLTAWLTAARAELNNEAKVEDIAKFLATVAEVIIEEICNKVCTALNLSDCFAIIGYGKLGSLEMNYDSDVDLVFLHTAPLKKEQSIIRLTQKILSMLTLRTQSGILYQVDTRLRPSGSSGLLVSRLQTYINYQQTEAWTWEHQALLRARILCGAVPIKNQFNKLKSEIIFLPRNKAQLKNDVKNMRTKIAENNKERKPGAEELLDLEFLIQYLILAHPSKDYVKVTNTGEQIKFLQKNKVLTVSQAQQLISLYYACHNSLHLFVLKNETKSSAGIAK